jgi:hypothetical protein
MEGNDDLSLCSQHPEEAARAVAGRLRGGHSPSADLKLIFIAVRAAFLLSPIYALELRFSGKVFQKTLQLERLIVRRDEAK